MIVVTGDSWACGEWDSEHGNVHGGLAEILKHNGHEVVNLAVPGTDNRTATHNLKWFLHNNQSHNITQIIFFKSDIARQINTPDLQRGYIDFKNTIIHSFYFALAEAVQKYQVPCAIIGGSSDAFSRDWTANAAMNYHEKLKGLTIAVPSFTNLIVNDNSNKLTFSIWREADTETILTAIKASSTNQDIAILIEDLDLAQRRYNLWHHNAEFFPDGNHPNRRAHQILYEFLIQEKYLNS